MNESIDRKSAMASTVKDPERGFPWEFGASYCLQCWCSRIFPPSLLSNHHHAAESTRRLKGKLHLSRFQGKPVSKYSISYKKIKVLPYTHFRPFLAK